MRLIGAQTLILPYSARSGWWPKQVAGERSTGLVAAPLKTMLCKDPFFCKAQMRHSGGIFGGWSPIHTDSESVYHCKDSIDGRPYHTFIPRNFTMAQIATTASSNVPGGSWIPGRVLNVSIQRGFAESCCCWNMKNPTAGCCRPKCRDIRVDWKDPLSHQDHPRLKWAQLLLFEMYNIIYYV